MPVGYQGFLDGIRRTKQRLSSRFNSRPDRSKEKPPVESTTPSPKSSSGRDSRAERMPAAYHDLVDRIRKAKQRFEERSNSTPAASSKSPRKAGEFGDDQSNRSVVPASHEEMARQIWESKQRGEKTAEAASVSSGPKTPGDNSSTRPLTKPGVVPDPFRLPTVEGSVHDEAVRNGLEFIEDPERPLPR